MKLREAKIFFFTGLQNIIEPRELEAMWRVITDEVLHMDPVDALLREEEEVAGFFPTKLELIVRRLQQGEPLQYIVGTARFHGHSFTVTPAVLIPRPETEQLVDIVVDENPGTDLQVLDMGTGCGCIAIALARALKFPMVTGIDNSGPALMVARENANTLKAKVRFVQADMLALGHEVSGPWDIIVSNPPYVCESEAPTMERHVLDHEPHNALFVPDEDPLKFYKAIARHGQQTLADGGRLYLEINRRFGNEVAQLLTHLGYTEVCVRKDFVGNPRFVTATLHDEN